jgi:diadenosine tetraphosphate (Ap4A) HIT family hydrolase
MGQEESRGIQGGCPFCCLEQGRILTENEHAVAIFDGFPISPGHVLIVPKRHVASIFESSPEEQRDLFALLTTMRKKLFHEKKADGFNIGINDGEAAGQTVFHLHIHLIPRYSGDITDPRGGVRWIFPEKAVYWSR